MKWEDIMLSLKKERLSRGMSLDEVAFSLGTSPAHVSTVERGLVCPSLKFVCSYADLLGTRVQLYGLSFL